MGGILVVDDELLISDLVKQWLTELHCEVIGPASSVRSALSLIDSVALDGAILDVSLRGENSYSVADALCKRAVPFAFVTGYGDADADVRARFPDAPILRKPFGFEDLRAAVAAFAAAPSGSGWRGVR